MYVCITVGVCVIWHPISGGRQYTISVSVFHYVATTSELTAPAKSSTFPHYTLTGVFAFAHSHIFNFVYVCRCSFVWQFLHFSNNNNNECWTLFHLFAFILLEYLCVCVCVCWIPHWCLSELVKSSSEVPGDSWDAVTAMEMQRIYVNNAIWLSSGCKYTDISAVTCRIFYKCT